MEGLSKAGGSSSCCFLCALPTATTPSPSKEDDQDTPPALRAQLETFFLASSLLKISSSDCVSLLSIYGDPGEWLSLCFSCQGRLKEAYRLNQAIRELVRKLEEVKEGLLRPLFVVKTEADEFIHGDIDVYYHFGHEDDDGHGKKCEAEGRVRELAHKVHYKNRSKTDKLDTVNTHREEEDAMSVPDSSSFPLDLHPVRPVPSTADKKNKDTDTGSSSKRLTNIKGQPITKKPVRKRGKGYYCIVPTCESYPKWVQDKRDLKRHFVRHVQSSPNSKVRCPLFASPSDGGKGIRCPPNRLWSRQNIPFHLEIVHGLKAGRKRRDLMAQITNPIDLNQAPYSQWYCAAKDFHPVKIDDKSLINGDNEGVQEMEDKSIEY